MQAQVISNYGAAISITNGTVVVSHHLTNTSGINLASLSNFGTLNLSGNFINGISSTISGNGIFYIGGNWSNSGSFLYGSSTVIFNGSINQRILRPLPSPENFNNLTIENTADSITLGNSVQVIGMLSMYSGNIVTDSHILHLLNPTVASLNYKSGKIFGLFERAIGETGRFLFPLGNLSRPMYYNPATLVINGLTNAGSVLSEFITPLAPVNIIPPLEDFSATPFVEVDSAFSAGYWSMTAKNGF